MNTMKNYFLTLSGLFVMFLSLFLFGYLILCFIFWDILPIEGQGCRTVIIFSLIMSGLLSLGYFIDGEKGEEIIDDGLYEIKKKTK